MTASALLGFFFAPSNAGKSLDQIQDEQTGDGRFTRDDLRDRAPNYAE